MISIENINAQTGQQLNLILKGELDSIYKTDQIYRQMDDSIRTKYGAESKEYQDMMLNLAKTDSSNLERVKIIIQTYGWPGRNLVGDTANNAVFLVIQHGDLRSQEKYLPYLRESVMRKESKGSQLAYLEDRVAIRNGRKQIYGTQMARDKTTGKYYVSLLEDPDNVDKRRGEIGLGPIADYIKKGWNLEWNVNEFKIEQAKREKL